ncbi:MAG: hypothetical protein WCC64_18695 [Aliidongia sp.]
MTFPIGPLEASVTDLSFALLLRDRLTFADALAGNVGVTEGSRIGQRKGTTGTFLFFDLNKGPISLSVRCAPDTPYYLPADIPVTVPMPSALWPAFPDITLADPSLALWDPKQPAAYRTQFLQACLAPSIDYPFDPGATLVRGTVTDSASKKTLAGVTVSDSSGNTLPYVTDTDGQFVLVFQQPAALPTSVTIRAQRQGHPDVDTQVTVRRAATVTLQIGL